VSHWAHCHSLMLASLLAIIGTILCLRADGGETCQSRRASWNKPITLNSRLIRSVELSTGIGQDEVLPACHPIDALIDVV
jgi:hypothetical protein